MAALEDADRGIFGVQFHPEVVHTAHGQEVLEHFLYDAVRAPADLDAERRSSSPGGRRSGPRSATAGLICGLSGGVDSAVAAALVHKAIGAQLTCVFVDTGLMRQGEGEQVVETFRRHQGIELIHVRAGDRFLERLDGVIDPEEKRKAIGECSSASSRKPPEALTDAKFLVQGTLYPDVIESGTADGGQDQEPPQRGRPARGHGLRAGRAAAGAVQGRGPRRLGTELGLPEEIVWRQPFPGPGLGVRIIGEVTAEKVAILQHADAIVREEIRGRRPRAGDLAGVRRAPRHPLGRRHGRRAHLRLPDHHPGRHQRGRHDRRLGPPALRRPGAHLQPDHRRGRRRQPGGLRHHVEAPGTIEWE